MVLQSILQHFYRCASNKIVHQDFCLVELDGHVSHKGAQWQEVCVALCRASLDNFVNQGVVDVTAVNLQFTSCLCKIREEEHYIKHTHILILND